MWFGVAGLITSSFALWVSSGGRIADGAVDASLASLVIAVAARHDGVVRGAFVLGRRVRRYRLHQLTFHLGQLHRAMAIAATMWFAIAVVDAAPEDVLACVLGGATLVLLGAMMWTARDAVRQHRHDRFERVHRYAGWTSLGPVTVLVLRQAAAPLQHGTGTAVTAAVTPVALLVVVLALVVHPWTTVRRLPVEVLDVTDRLVVLALVGSRKVGEFVRVSLDGAEWHAFAVATTGCEGPGRYCLVIRRAGDWTENLAREAQGGLPRGLLVRTMRGYGFMYHAQTFRRVLFVATGAGIGPVLPYLLGSSLVGYECLWLGREHRTSMGKDLVERVVAGGGVTLVDTSAGRPDLASLVRRRAPYVDAVFVVSNDTVREQVAQVCEEMGVAWYGPTFDS
ncbi:MAG: hypothetical protein L0H96_25055 [Humibacillus sp.]|nr:hypothetical protein [Humibacillus sp.]MDN5780151.1 hypothetical protein [Humibacillus sp.]